MIGDSLVVSVLNNGEIKGSDFVVHAGGVALTDSGRRSVLRAYERRLDTEVSHPVFGYRVTYRPRDGRKSQARMMAAYLLREVPEYLPFTTR